MEDLVRRACYDAESNSQEPWIMSAMKRSRKASPGETEEQRVVREFFYAVQHGDMEGAMALAWEPGALDHIDEISRRSALGYACSLGDEPLALALLELGADPNLRLASGRAPLMDCCAARDELVQALIEAGAEVDARDAAGWSALHCCFQGAEGSEQAARALLAAGADPDAKTEAGEAPVHLAAWAGDEGLLRMLAEAGADFEALGARGFTAAQCARTSGGIPAAEFCDALVLAMSERREVGLEAKGAKAGPRKGKSL